MPVTARATDRAADRAPNRGPAAAADNRRALLASARRLFATHGYRVPLSAVARDAGVGQGSLYRHFPTRVDLALAIFADNYAQLEARAADDHGAGAFHRLWQRLLALTLESIAFVELAVDARHEFADRGQADRLRRLLDAKLADAQVRGELAGELTVDDLLLVLRMVYGVMVTETDPVSVRAVAHRALVLIDPALSINHEEHQT